MFIKQYGNSQAKIRMIWLHGWGQNHHALSQLYHLFTDEADHYLIDLPGFGDSKAPTEAWGTLDYTNTLIQWLRTLPTKETYIIGYSFGGRVAIQTASLIGSEIAGIILLAAAGLKRKRSIFFKIKAYTLKYLATTCQLIDQYFKIKLKEKFSKNFGSRDYKASSGIMRRIFVKIINEDLTYAARKIIVPTLLIYGMSDQETPAEFGQTYHVLIRNSKFFVLPKIDHYSILSLAKHQVYHLITIFLTKEK